MKRIVVIGILWISLMNGCIAQPDFTGMLSLRGITFFKDAIQPTVYYYQPGDLDIAKLSSGRPDFNFIMMRYTGSAVYSEEEQLRFKNILSMRLIMKSIHEDSLKQAKRDLSRSTTTVQLKPLPISQIEAMIVFTPVGSSDDSTLVVKKGDLGADDHTGYSTAASYWQERYFTLYLDNYSANILLEAFTKDYTAMSFMYAFYSTGISDKKILTMSGHDKLQKKLQEQLKNSIADSTASTQLRECVVKSNAFAIELLTDTYPDLIQKIDINDGVPPGYAILNVRNYDFANNLRIDLYEKTVELEAIGAGGKKVSASVRFNLNAPEITSTNFKFRYAVRLDRPYRYRVRELLTNGRETVSEWKDVSTWSTVLDVTSRPSITH
jgi:hypothetical protein